MNKKKHQNQNDQGDDSTESCDENKNSVECPHIKKAVDVPNLKRVLIKSGLITDCEQCKASPLPCIDPDTLMEVEYDQTLWLCLKCGYQACGRGRNRHALQHYETPRSDCHALCVNTHHWAVWCYGCDEEINCTAKLKLLEAVKFVKRFQQTKNRKDQVIEIASVPSSCGFVVGPVLPIAAGSGGNGGNDVSHLRPRGSLNLGNTCFFNSVMQCLTRTPYLLELLEETSQPGQAFCLPGGKLQLESDDGTETKELAPLEGTLKKWRSLTAALAETLESLACGRAECFVPKTLFDELTYKMPQFAGGDQHDAHELLRNLLEAVREEDLKRYQTVILKQLGFNRKTDLASVTEIDKKIIKFYGQQASELLLPTEQVFRGVLVSTLQCQECGHTSHRDEFFLDLSLPIRQLPPVFRRRGADTVDSSVPPGAPSMPSKHQWKKEKRAERKNKKKQKSQQRAAQVSLIPGAPTSMSPTKEFSDEVKTILGLSESESDADVEDNVEVAKPPVASNQPSVAKAPESGYNSDKVDNSSPDTTGHRHSSPSSDAGAPTGATIDSGVPSPAVGPGESPTPDTSPVTGESYLASVSLKESESLNSLCCQSPAPPVTPASSDMEMGSPLIGNGSPDNELVEDYERPESRLSFVKPPGGKQGSDLKMNLAKLSLMHDGDSRKVSEVLGAPGEYDSGGYAPYISGYAVDDSCGEEVMDTREAGVEDEDDSNAMQGAGATDDDVNSDQEDPEEASMYTDTISPRYQSSEGECSVQSCLNQFTACELMTGNNKVGCELCTKRQHGVAAPGEKKPTVYTNATKQLLIYNPPAVLILHLKRFQACGRIQKVSKAVKFPMLLDLAPFCSKRSQNLPTFEQGQSRVLFSLYGIVEHIGSIHGGHYVAYVKVRSNLEADSYRWQFLPKNQSSEQRSGVPGAQADPPVPHGKWYRISDSHWTACSETEVLDAQAYLLFYERIL